MNKQPEVKNKTREKFIESFFELAKEKNIRQISVGELSRLAGYNRSTFYEYFIDMPDLITQAEDKLLNQIIIQIKESNLSLSAIKSNEKVNMFRLLFSMLNEPMYSLLGPNGDPYFFSRIKSFIIPEISKLLEIDSSSVYFEYIVSYFYSAAIGFLQHWHETGENIPEEDLFNLGYNLLTHGIFSVVDSDFKINGNNIRTNPEK